MDRPSRTRALAELGSAVAFDTESANTGAPHLIEIGAVRTRDGEAVDHFQALVAPAVPVEPATTEIHGLRDEDLARAEMAETVLPAFFRWLDGDALVAHDARWDAQVLGFACARARLEPPPVVVHDSLALAKDAFPECPDHRLETLVEHLGIEGLELHRALPDAVACWQVVERALEVLEEREGPAQLRKALSLPDAVPPRPTKRPVVRRALEAARDAEETVVLVYGGPGETPGRREVLPRLLYRAREKSYLEAECPLSGTLKTYRLDRIHKVRPL